MASHNTPQDGAEGFKCSHCFASFTTKSVLSVHMRDAHGDKSQKKGNGNGHQSLVKTGNKAAGEPATPPQPIAAAAATGATAAATTAATAVAAAVVASVPKVSPKVIVSGSPVVKASPSAIIRSPNSPAT